MTWTVVYFGCFAVGLAMTVLAMFAGGGHGHGWHGLAGHGAGPHGVAGPHGAVGHGLPGQGAGSSGPRGGVTARPGFLNGVTVPAFLCWFGGAGYLLRTQTRMGAPLVVLLAMASGTVGAGLLFGFLTRVLLPHERELTAEETRVTGAVGRVTTAVEPGRTAELHYRQMGVRRSVPVRLETGAAAIERGGEAVVLRMEKGVGRVMGMEELVRKTEAASRGESAAGERDEAETRERAGRTAERWRGRPS